MQLLVSTQTLENQRRKEKERAKKKIRSIGAAEKKGGGEPRRNVLSAQLVLGRKRIPRWRL